MIQGKHPHKTTGPSNVCTKSWQKSERSHPLTWLGISVVTSEVDVKTFSSPSERSVTPATDVPSRHSGGRWVTLEDMTCTPQPSLSGPLSNGKNYTSTRPFSHSPRKRSLVIIHTSPVNTLVLGSTWTKRWIGFNSFIYPIYKSRRQKYIRKVSWHLRKKDNDRLVLVGSVRRSKVTSPNPRTLVGLDLSALLSYFCNVIVTRYSRETRRHINEWLWYQSPSLTGRKGRLGKLFRSVTLGYCFGVEGKEMNRFWDLLWS